MSALHFSAHDLCRTRLCQAAGCEGLAEPGWALCERCEQRQRRGYLIVMHEVVQPEAPDPETMLICATCSEWKPDAEFSIQSAGKEHRRKRRGECRACSTTRRRNYRARLEPEKRAAQAQHESEHKRAARQARRSQLGWPPS